MKFEAFKQLINKKRRTGGWYSFNGNVEGKSVQLKGFGTWLQRYVVDGINFDSPMDIKVGTHLKYLEKPFIKKKVCNA